MNISMLCYIRDLHTAARECFVMWVKLVNKKKLLRYLIYRRNPGQGLNMQYVCLKIINANLERIH